MWSELPFPLWQRGLFMLRGLGRRGEKKKTSTFCSVLWFSFNVLTVCCCFFVHKMSQGCPQRYVCTSTEYIQWCTLAVFRPEWWITKVGMQCAERKKKYECSVAHKHLVFHRATQKSCSFYDNPALHNAISRLTATYADVCCSVAFCSIEPSLFSKPVTLA